KSLTLSCGAVCCPVTRVAALSTLLGFAVMRGSMPMALAQRHSAETGLRQLAFDGHDLGCRLLSRAESIEGFDGAINTAHYAQCAELIVTSCESCTLFRAIIPLYAMGVQSNQYMHWQPRA